MMRAEKKVVNSDSEAVAWYRKAGDQGDDDAQTNLGLGIMYSQGDGVPQDYTEAAKWFGRAAEQGDADAQALLGAMYYEGRSVPQDYGKAVKWYRRAAEQGHAAAQFYLGSMYHEGRGVSQDNLGGAPATAEIYSLGVFRDWIAYETTQGGNQLCYMASEPKKDEGNYTRRGRIYAIVSHRPAANSLDVVSIHAGYTYREASEVTVAIGDKSFTLFTHGDAAWAKSVADDKAIVAAMKAGTVMVVRGVSSGGTLTKDTYSLLDFTAAYRAISKACGLN